MTTLKDQLKDDVTAAMKSGDRWRASALRTVRGEIQTQEKSGKTARDFNDDEVQALLTREVKRRRDAAIEYRKGNAEDRAVQEEREADLIDTYLPEKRSNEEVEQIVNGIVEGYDNPGMKDFGAIMKQAMTALGNQADGKVVSGLVRARLV